MRLPQGPPATSVFQLDGTPLTPALARKSGYQFTLDPFGFGLAFVTAPWANVGLDADFDRGFIFLGHIYPAQVLDQYTHGSQVDDSQVEELCERSGSAPDLERFLILMLLKPPALRAAYMYCMYMHRQLAAFGDLPRAYAEALDTEHRLWSLAEGNWVKRRIQPHIQRERVRDVDHWLWTQARAPRKRPDIMWHGRWNVPVHRLLWPQFRPTELLLPNRRLIKRDICPDEQYKACVNPHHYEYAVAYTDRLALKPGQQNTQRLSTSQIQHIWTEDNVWVDTWNGVTREYVHCPNRHLMPPGVQDSLLLQRDPQSNKYDPHPHGRSVCRACRERAALERGLKPDGSIKKRPRGLKQPNNLTNEQAFNDFQYGLINSILKNGGRIHDA
jgi:hypothetical protein